MDSSKRGLKEAAKIPLEAGILAPVLAILIAVTEFYQQNPLREALLTAMLFGVCLGYAAYGFYSSMNLEKVKASELIALGILAALFCTGIYWGMLLPAFLYNVIPILSGLSFYFPAAIIYGVMRRVVKFRGASFMYFVIYGIVSEIIFPNLYWVPYFIGWGGVAELLARLGERYGEGFGFGFAGSGLCKCFIILNWGQWTPLLWNVPAVFADGGFSLIGFLIGEEIGRRVSSLPM